MVAATRSTTLISNAEAVPPVANDSIVEFGKKRVISGTIETAAADNAGAVYALCRLNPDWAVTSIKLFHDDVTNMTTADLGLYTGSLSSDLTVADVDCYASAVDLSAANLRGSVVTTYADFAWEARDIALMGQRVYADAGDSLGDFDSYVLALTATTNDATAAKTISFVVEVIAE